MQTVDEQQVMPPMLILGHKQGSRIRIEVDGKVLWLKIRHVGRKYVKVSYHGPKEFSIMREEVLPVPALQSA